MKIEANTFDYQMLIEVMPVGHENAKSQHQLCEELGCKPEQLKATIQRFRRQNTDKSLCILSCGKGYFIAENNEEKRKFLRMMQGQATARFKTVQQIKRLMDEPDNQQTFDDNLKR